MTGSAPFLVLAAEQAADAAAAGDFVSIAQRGGVAMLLGLLIGAEREYSHTEKELLFAGVRTFPLIALLGFTAGLLGTLSGSPLVFAAISISFGLLIVSTYILTSLGEDKGATTEIAGLTVYFLGALCWYGRPEHLTFASAAAVAATLLLSMREAIHGMVGKFEKEDIFAALKLATVSLIVLPILTNDMLVFDPSTYSLEYLREVTARHPAATSEGKEYVSHLFAILNPYKTWWYVVLIASISFAGYIAVKVLGTRRGVGLTGLFGGLSSSTAVAVAFSKKSREEPRLCRTFASAIVLASTIMFPRVLFVASAACPLLFASLWKPVLLLTATGLVASLVLHLRGETDEHAAEGVKLKNPFELGSAIKFGFVLAGIGMVSRTAYALYRETGFYLASGLVGMADADGLASQAAEQATAANRAAHEAAKAGMEVHLDVPFLAVATTGIVVAMIANTLVKGTLTVTLGSPGLRRFTVPAFGAMALAGIAGAFLLV